MVEFSINKLNELLNSLKGLQIKEAVSLRKRLEKEMQPQKKVLEEKPQGDLLEVEDARASSFFITFDTNC